MPTLPPLPAGVTVSRSPGTGGVSASVTPAPIKALDTYAVLTPAKLTALKADGYGAVGGYYFAKSGFKHIIDRLAAHAVSAAGLRLWTVFEDGNPTTGKYFSKNEGNDDAHVAWARAMAVGQSAGTPVFFAVDYDAEPGDIPAIVAYFTEVRRVFAVLGDTHPLGVYSSGLVCRTLKEAGLVSFSWLSQSRGFHGYADWKPHADIIQGPVQTIHGMDCDTDTILNPAVLWSV